MSPKEFAQACRDIVYKHEGHIAHRALDKLVTGLLTDLGYGEGMAIFIREVTPYHGELLYQIEQYLERTGMPATTFGRVVTNDPGLVRGLRRGRRPLGTTSRRILNFIGEAA